MLNIQWKLIKFSINMFLLVYLLALAACDSTGLSSGVASSVSPTSTTSTPASSSASISALTSKSLSPSPSPSLTSTPQISLLASNVGFAGSPNIVVDSKGNVYYPNTNGSTIGKIDTNGNNTIFAGSASCGDPYCIVDGVGTAATFSRPYLLAIDGSDNIYVADYGYYYIRKITPDGIVSTIAPLDATCFGFAVDPSGNFYCSETGEEWTATHVIIKISASGTLSTFAGSGVAGNSNGSGTSASFNNPHNLVSDTSGNIYVADLGNYMIRKISPSGNVTSFAGSGIQGIQDGSGSEAMFSFDQLLGDLSIDAAGNLFVGDSAFSTAYIRKITPAGVVSTYCGNGSASVINADGSCSSSGVWVNAGIAVSASDTVFYGSGTQIFKIVP